MKYMTINLLRYEEYFNTKEGKGFIREIIKKEDIDAIESLLNWNGLSKQFLKEITEKIISLIEEKESGIIRDREDISKLKRLFLYVVQHGNVDQEILTTVCDYIINSKCKYLDEDLEGSLRILTISNKISKETAIKLYKHMVAHPNMGRKKEFLGNIVSNNKLPEEYLFEVITTPGYEDEIYVKAGKSLKSMRKQKSYKEQYAESLGCK